MGLLIEETSYHPHAYHLKGKYIYLLYIWKGMLSYNISLYPWNIVLWAPILGKAPRKCEIKHKDQCWACKSFSLIYRSSLANLAFKK